MKTIGIIFCTLLLAVWVAGCSKETQANNPPEPTSDNPRDTVRVMLEAIRANNGAVAVKYWIPPVGSLETDRFYAVIDLAIAAHKLASAAVARFGPESMMPEDMRDATIDAAIAQLAAAPAEETNGVTLLMVKRQGPTAHFSLFRQPLSMVKQNGHWRILAPTTGEVALLDVAKLRLGAEICQRGARDIAAGKYPDFASARAAILGEMGFK